MHHKQKPHKGLYVAPSTISGQGLFTSEAIKSGAFVIEYVGTILPNSIADDLETAYLFDLENGTTIDGSPEWNMARYVNYSCMPNVEAELDEEEHRIFFNAIRDIEPGEELTIDYGEEYVKDFISPHGCACGSCSSEKKTPPTSLT